MTKGNSLKIFLFTKITSECQKYFVEIISSKSLPKLLKLFNLVKKKHGCKRVGLIFPIRIYCKFQKSSCLKSEGLEVRYVASGLFQLHMSLHPSPTRPHTPNCPTLSDQCSFFLYIYTENITCIENCDNLTYHWPDFKLNLHNYPETKAMGLSWATEGYHCLFVDLCHIT